MELICSIKGFSTPAMTLCQNCLDSGLISTLLGRHRPMGQGVHVIPGGVLEEYWISRVSDKRQTWTWIGSRDCTFCNFLRSILLVVTGSSSRDIHSEMVLEVFASARKRGTKSTHWEKWRYVRAHLVPSSSVDYRKSLHGSPQTFIGCFGSTGPSSSLSGQHDDLKSVREIPDYIDLAKMRSLFEMCVRTHENCQPIKRRHAKYPTNLRLIDCTTRCIVRAEKEQQYAALSYQWGSSHQQCPVTEVDEVLSQVPSTIEDAMTVTSGLGLRYLWVDAYCIIQSSPEDFRHQVKQMDLVYTRAHVTLIAAFGYGAESGLPGISCVAERNQAKGYYHDMPLLSFARDSWDSVKSSRWCTRGWTFQESFFSMRRLIFTSRQYILDCHERSFAESEAQEQFCSSWRNQPIPRWTSGMNEKRVFRLIEEYAARHLTYPNDILNAFQGIVSAVEADVVELRFYCGIPLSLSRSTCHDSFVRNLLWSIPESYDVTYISNRRERFSSWSWAGWDGAVNFDETVKGKAGTIMATVEKVLLFVEPNRWACWSEFENMCTDRKESLDQAQRFVLSAPSIGVALSQRLIHTEGGRRNTLDTVHKEYVVHLNTQHNCRSYVDLEISFEKLTDVG